MSALKWDCSAVVYINEGCVVAEDRFGGVIASGKAGVDDAVVLQATIDGIDPTGMIRLTKGTYVFSKTVYLYNSITLAGEGRGTVIVPPAGEYAIWAGTTHKTTVFRPYHGDPGPQYAFVIRDLMIDGKPSGKKGKGIRLEHFWNASFENLWISDTGTALYLWHCKESDFRNIHLISNGDEKAKQASLIMTGENNNVHFRGLYVIYPNYVGMDLIGTRAEGIEIPRLVYVTQSMFHGWIREDGPASYDMIRVKDLDAQRTGCLADFVIRDSRITTVGPGAHAVNVINSPVTLANSVVTASRGECVVRASDRARVTVTANSFHGGAPTGSIYALYAEDSEVLFKDNTLVGVNLTVALKGKTSAIVADNRFNVQGPGPTVSIGDGCCCVDVRGNVFNEPTTSSAIAVSDEACEVFIGDNHYVGTYSKEALACGPEEPATRAKKAAKPVKKKARAK